MFVNYTDRRFFNTAISITDWAIHSFGHNTRRKQPILEGDMPFESPKSPLKSGLLYEK
jgi:hypothetical protein